MACDVVCAECGEPADAGANWCEACGGDLSVTPKPACVACGEHAVETDRYCHSCGHRQPAERDHVVTVDGAVAAVSDRGQRHRHNEDAVAAVEIDGGAVIVVCDGVSSTPGSALVSAAAAEAAARTLAQWEPAAAPAEADEPGHVGAIPDTALTEAVAAAQAATIEAAADNGFDPDNPPSTTLVAALARTRPATSEVLVSVAWLGDSRAYWIDGSAAHPLTEDHEIGGALTRWLGPDGDGLQAEIGHHRFPITAGPTASSPLLVVCSDGLWRYCTPTADEPIETVVARLRSDGLVPGNAEAEAGAGAGAKALAEALVAFANDSGGHDNVSVGLWSPPRHETEREPRT